MCRQFDSGPRHRTVLLGFLAQGVTRPTPPVQCDPTSAKARCARRCKGVPFYSTREPAAPWKNRTSWTMKDPSLHRRELCGVAFLVASAMDGSPEVACGDTFFFYEPDGLELARFPSPLSSRMITPREHHLRTGGRKTATHGRHLRGDPRVGSPTGSQFRWSSRRRRPPPRQVRSRA